MSQSLIEQLRHPDPARRKQAILALARAADQSALTALAEVYRSDESPELRELALKAGRHIKTQAKTTIEPPKLSSFRAGLKAKREFETSEVPAMRVESPTSAPVEAINDIPLKKPLPPLKRAPTSQKKQGSSIFSLVLLLFMLGVLAVLSVYFVRDVLPRYQTAARIQAVSGNIENHFSTTYGLPYFVMRPQGERPPNGWRAVILIHGQGGNGRDMINIFAPHFHEAGVLLIAPSLPDAGQGRINYQESQRLLNDALDSLWSYQDPDHPELGFVFRYDTSAGGGPIMAGFSAGAAFTALFAHDYGADLSGVVLMGLPIAAQDVTLPTRRDLPFRITVGEFDERLDAASHYYSRLSARGNPAVFEIISNSGHQISQEEINILLEFVDDVYGG